MEPDCPKGLRPVGAKGMAHGWVLMLLLVQLVSTHSGCSVEPTTTPKSFQLCAPTSRDETVLLLPEELDSYLS